MLELMSRGFLHTVELDESHRCDRCGARAYLAATKGPQLLLFCGHHGGVNMNGLMEKGWDIQDDRMKLYEKPKADEKEADVH